MSFCSNNPGKELFSNVVIEETGREQVMWPVHCVQDSHGAEYHKDLVLADTDLEVLKGLDRVVESYSAFGNEHEDTGLTSKLKEAGITEVYVCGLAFDYCVGSTAESAANAGFKSFLLDDMARSVAGPSKEQMLVRLKAAGVQVITSDQV